MTSTGTPNAMKPLIFAAAALAAAPLSAQELDKVVFATNWFAQGGHGGWVKLEEAPELAAHVARASQGRSAMSRQGARGRRKTVSPEREADG